MLVRAAIALCFVALATPARAANISGQVTLAGGAGASGVQVFVFSLTAKGWTVNMSTLTNGSGNYSVTVGAGDYLVQAVPANISTQCFYARRYFDVVVPNAGGTLESAADVLTLGAASALTGINIALPTAGGIDGRVVQGATGINGVLVRVESRSDSRIHVDTTTATLGGIAGSYSACGVDPGNYLIWLHSPTSQHEDLVAPGPYTVTAGSRFSLGNFNLVTIGTDPNEPNPTVATSTPVPTFVDSYTSTGAIIVPFGSDADFYCLDALAGDRYLITSDTTTNVLGEPRSSPWIDPQLGWYSASPVQQLAANDDDPLTPGSLNARIATGSVAADGRYCVAVTTFGDPDFNGSGQQSAGRYALRIARVVDAVFADGFE